MAKMYCALTLSQAKYHFLYFDYDFILTTTTYNNFYDSLYKQEK
jgi:hypothetical protein